jgi:tetratricopeptide (TPR) repeat protein
MKFLPERYLLYWSRKGELSAGRTAAVVIGGPQSVVDVTLRLGGGPKAISNPILLQPRQLQGAMNSLPRQRARRVLSCLLVLATMLQPAFGQPSNDPQELEKSGISRIDHWVDYVRRTGDAKSTVYELEAAQSDLQGSYDLFLKRQDFADASLSAIKMADIQRLKNQWRQAMPIFQDAIGLAQHANRTDYQTKALAHLAYCELRLGDTDAAGDHIREAVRLGENCANKDFYFDALDIAGEIEAKRGNLVAAGEYLDRALAMSGQIDDKRQLYLGYSDRGNIYLQLASKSDYQRDFDTYYRSLELARADYQKAVALSRELGFDFWSQSAQQRVKDVDVREALIRWRQRMDQIILTNAKLFSPQKPTDVLVTERFNIAGAWDPAMLAPIESMVKKLEDFQARMQQQGLTVLDLDPSDLFRRGQLAEMKGDNAAALAAYSQALDLLEKDRRKLRDEQARGAFMEDKIDYYYPPALLLLDRKQYSEAFELFERSRSRAMADLLASRPLTLGTPQERTLFSELQTLKINIAAQQAKLFNLTGSQNPDQNAKEIVQLENQIAGLQQ